LERSRFWRELRPQTARIYFRNRSHPADIHLRETKK
jgi:hypothetical protein